MKNQDYHLLSKHVDALGGNGGIRTLAAFTLFLTKRHSSVMLKSLKVL